MIEWYLYCITKVDDCLHFTSHNVSNATFEMCGASDISIQYPQPLAAAMALLVANLFTVPGYTLYFTVP